MGKSTLYSAVIWAHENCFTSFRKMRYWSCSASNGLTCLFRPVDGGGVGTSEPLGRADEWNGATAGPSPGGAFAVFAFFLYFIGELLPIFVISFFHHKNNKTYEKKCKDAGSIQPEQPSVANYDENSHMGGRDGTMD